MNEANMFPPRFDYQFYVKDKSFLTSPEDALRHFKTIGLNSGLEGSPACNQGYFVNLIKGLNPQSILEIGPGCSPKLQGNNVYYFDVKSEEELRKRYRGEPGYNNIPDKIHFTDNDGNLNSINRKFDVVFSSHMIEHSFDLIDHINSVASLLNENGHYFIIAPNKNYTFDYFKPVSLPEDVMAHHFSCGNNPALSLRTVLLEKCRRAHNSPQRHWAGDHGEPMIDHKDVLNAIKNFGVIANDPIARSGFHSWIFTDESFAQLINGLHELNQIAMKLLEYYNTPLGSCSFTAILKR